VSLHSFRSLLFAPGDSPRKIEKAFASQADGVIIDLEDSVALSEKSAARSALASVLSQSRRLPTFVRVNAVSTSYFSDDMKALSEASLHGVMVPKVESAADLRSVDAALRGYDCGGSESSRIHEILPILETARGLSAASEIAGACPRVKRLTFGAIDLALDMNLSLEEPRGAIDHARFLVALVSRAAGLEPPFDTAFADFKDLAGLKSEALRARAFGFFGKGCIHPAQIDVVNTIFAPTESEIAHASRIVEAFNRAEREGIAAIQVDGRMVDYPVAAKARRLLAQAHSNAE
jgi:citrate lyase subunit beta/citryl-CoA lyase